MNTYPILLISDTLKAIPSSKPKPPPEPILPALSKPLEPKISEEPAEPQTLKSRFANSGWIVNIAIVASALLSGFLDAIDR